MKITKPEATEFFDYYGTYINKVLENDLLLALNENSSIFSNLIKQIPSEKQDYSYATGKWTVKEVIGHVIDAERIFAYRALRFARNDKTSLAGFEENDYVPESNVTNRTLQELFEEFTAVRNASITLFKSFTPDMCLRSGQASNKNISVRALGFIIVGHAFHHQQIIQERYLNQAILNH